MAEQRSGQQKEEKIFWTPNKRVICYSWNEEFDSLHDTAEIFIRNAKLSPNENIFVNGRVLFRIADENGEDIAEPLDVAGMQDVISETSCWMKQQELTTPETKAIRKLEGILDSIKDETLDKDKIRKSLKDAVLTGQMRIYESAKVPIDAVRVCLKLKKFNLPRLDRVIHHPFLSSNYKIVYQYGYNDETKSWVQCKPEVEKAMQSINEAKPEMPQVAEAMADFFDLFMEFPFRDESDATGLLALALTLYCKPFFKGHVPITLIQSSGRSTGKTLLVQTVIAAVTGQKADIMPAKFRDEEELEKKTFAKLMTLPEYIIFDELDTKREIRSPYLQAIVTSGIAEGRILGRSEVRKLPFDIPLIMTGNNPRFSPDLSIRTFPINLEQTQADMNQRSFRIRDPDDEALKRHPRICRDLGIMIRWWITQGGKKEGSAKFGKFDDWAKKLSGIMDSLERQGFLKDRQVFAEEADTETEKLISFISYWYEKYGESKAMVSDLIEAGADAEIIEKPKSGEIGRRESTILGTYIREHRNQKVRDPDTGDTYRIELDSRTHNKPVWKLHRFVKEMGRNE